MEPGSIHVLLVEDNPGDARLVREMLSEAGAEDFTLHAVTTVRDAVACLAADAPRVDAVLLDLTLPDEAGLATLARVVQAVDGRAAIVVMTGADDKALGLSAVQEGAEDYLVKGEVDAPGLRRSLLFAIGRHLRVRSESLKDDLTGLHNRRGFLLLADQQIKVARRASTPFLLFYFDLDQLKQVNDTFGHAEGNRALVEAADVLRGCFRQSDLLARLSGDEFAALALVSADADADESSIRARLAATLAGINARPDRAYALELSVGALACPPRESHASVDALLARADALMYHDKRRKADLGARVT